MNASVPISQHALLIVWEEFLRLQTQEQKQIPRIGSGTGGLYYLRMITKPSDTKCVVKYTLKWLPMSGVEGHSTHWRLLVFSIKYGQSNAQTNRGSWSWRLYGRTAWGLEDLRSISFRNVDQFFNRFRSIFQSISIVFSLIYDVFCSNNT